MQPREAGERAKTEVAPPWDELRAARVQRRVLDAMRAPAPARARSRWRLLTLVAATLSLVSLVIAFVVLRPGPEPTARLELADGSFAVLEPSARVVPELVSDTRVELRQLEGNASYDVTPKPTRLFVVHVDDARVEVLGTAFRVEKEAASIRVIVSRGRVRVTRGARVVELAAGEQVTLAPETQPTAEAAALPAPEPVPNEPAATSAATASAASPSEPPAPSQVASSEHASELFRRADVARAAGNHAEAVRLLRELVQSHPRDGRATLANFTIGRIESQRGNAAAAAAAFEACGAAMSGEALAEAALARAAAGQTSQAKALAAQYRKLFPEGPRNAQMEKLGG